jgi:hypothetical protein
MAILLGRLSGSLTARVIDSMGYSGKDYNVRLKNDLMLGTLVSAVGMREFLDFRMRGIDVKAVRYEDLVARPRECCQLILEHCGLPASWVDKAVKGLERDSQRRSPVSKDNIGGLYEPEVTPKVRAELNDLLRGYGLPTLDEECVIDGTMSYKKD